MTNTEIRPFRIDVPQSELDELLRRLDDTRWSDPVPGDAATDWDRGAPTAYLRELVDHWRTGYDWRKTEAALNAYPQFTTEIDGQTIHFFHVRSPEPDAVPLLLTHGYPSSVVEFARLLGPLSDPRSYGGDPADAFHLVVPSLPGFGFSTPLSSSGWEVGRTTEAFAELMTRLGYDRFGAQGGDIGAGVTGRLAALYPDRLIGTHVNSDAGMLGLAGEQFPIPGHLTDDELAVVERFRTNWVSDRGYLVLQSHRPSTIGAALTDSPVAQLAWIAEKYKAWSNPDGGIDRDTLLTTVSLYWFTRSGASAARFLYEAAHSNLPWVSASTVPSGWAVFNSDPVVRRFMDPGEQVSHWSDFSEGGHFPAMEAGDLLVDDVRTFFRTLRS